MPLKSREFKQDSNTQISLSNPNTTTILGNDGALNIISGNTSTSLGTLQTTNNSGGGSTDAWRITGGNNGATEIARFRGDGRVGIGTTTPSYRTQIIETNTGTSGSLFTASINQTLDPSSASTATTAGLDVIAITATGATQKGTTVLGSRYLIHRSATDTGAITTMRGIQLQALNAAALSTGQGTVTTLEGAFIQAFDNSNTTTATTTLRGANIATGISSNTVASRVFTTVEGGFFQCGMGAGSTSTTVTNLRVINVDCAITGSLNRTGTITNAIGALFTGWTTAGVFGSGLTFTNAPEYIRLETTSVTGAMSIRSQGTGVHMRHAGKVFIGADTAPTYMLDINSQTNSDTVVQRITLNGDTNYALHISQVSTILNTRWSFSHVNNGTTYSNTLLLMTGYVGVGGGSTSPTAYLHITPTALASPVTTPADFRLTSAANTGLLASTEKVFFDIDTSASQQWATGAITTQRFSLFRAPTITTVGVSTITDTATVAISGAPIKSTNATLTNTHGLLIQAGAVSTATNSYGLTVNAQTGATNNYAGYFNGRVGVGVAAPSAWLDVGVPATTGTVVPDLEVMSSAHTALTASTERHDIYINSTRTQEWATGALAQQRFIRIGQPTVGFVGASTITVLQNMYLEGCAKKGTNATVQNTYALYIEGADAGAATNAYSFYAGETSGATNNYAAYLNGKTGIKQSAPTAYLHLGAGTATASTAPLKFTSGTNLTTAETGAVEYDGNRLYLSSLGTVTRQEVTTSMLKDVSIITTNTTAAETTHFTTTIPGGTLGTSRGLRMIIMGHILNNKGSSGTVTYRLKYGGTTFYTATHTVANNANERGTEVTAWLTARNSASVQEANCWSSVGAVSTVAGAGAALDSQFFAHYHSLGIASASNQTLEFTIQMNASSASFQVITDTVFIEYI